MFLFEQKDIFCFLFEQKKKITSLTRTDGINYLNDYFHVQYLPFFKTIHVALKEIILHVRVRDWLNSWLKTAPISPPKQQNTFIIICYHHLLPNHDKK